MSLKSLNEFIIYKNIITFFLRVLFTLKNGNMQLLYIYIYIYIIFFKEENTKVKEGYIA
jgi:hypothetical protein